MQFATTRYMIMIILYEGVLLELASRMVKFSLLLVIYNIENVT